jgi:hypothetical protein
MDAAKIWAERKIAAGAFEASITQLLPEVYSGMWVDGLMTGIIFQELREQSDRGE